MEITTQTANEFVKILVSRGLGIYGFDKMARICSDSGIVLHENGTIDTVNSGNLETILEGLILNYSRFNLPAKMTAMVLAKKHGIPIPDELKRKKRKSRFRQMFGRPAS